MVRFLSALLAAAAIAVVSHASAYAQDTATSSGSMTVTANIPGDIHAGGYFSKKIVLPASGDVVITVKQTSGICLAGGIPAVQKGRGSSGGTLFAKVYQGPESYGPSDETGECMHTLTVAPKSAGEATVLVSNFSGQTIDVSMTITGASEPAASTTAAATTANGETLPGAPATGRAVAR